MQNLHEFINLKDASWTSSDVITNWVLQSHFLTWQISSSSSITTCGWNWMKFNEIREDFFKPSSSIPCNLPSNPHQHEKFPPILCLICTNSSHWKIASNRAYWHCKITHLFHTALSLSAKSVQMILYESNYRVKEKLINIISISKKERENLIKMSNI